MSSGSSKSVASLDGNDRVLLEIVTPAGASQPWFNILMSRLGTFAGDRLRLSVYNDCGAAVTVNLVYKLSNSDSAPTAIELAPGWNMIDIDLSTYGVSEVAALAFMLDGEEPSYRFYMGEVKYYEN